MESKSKRAQPPEGALNLCREFPVETIGVFERLRNIQANGIAPETTFRNSLAGSISLPSRQNDLDAIRPPLCVPRRLGGAGFGANESCSAYRYFLIAGFLRCGIGLHSGQIL